VQYAKLPGDYIMNLAVESPIRLQGNLFNLTDGQGDAGDVVPIVATLMDHRGLIPGATVTATITNEGGAAATLLLDDGNNHDGSADDGIYGFPYSFTSLGGSYSVRIVARFPDPVDPSETLLREWRGGFWINGPRPDHEYEDDGDGDGMPDDWERRCKLIVGQDDSEADNDGDGLSNYQEFLEGTSPCRADTDGGGEQDGSEVNAGRNPLWAEDDRASRVKNITLLPLNGRVAIKWSQRPDTHTNVRLCVSEAAGDLGDCQDMGNEGRFVLTNLTNGLTYYLTLYGEGEGGAEGVRSDQLAVTPREDPIPPQGAFFIGGPNVTEGGDVATSREVVLFVDAADTDSEYLGPDDPGAHGAANELAGKFRGGMTAARGSIQMRFSNTLKGIQTAQWEPLSSSRPWTLACANATLCTVYGQFQDGAGNESLVVDQSVLLQLPPGVGCETDGDCDDDDPCTDNRCVEGECEHTLQTDDGDDDGVLDCNDDCPDTPPGTPVGVNGCEECGSGAGCGAMGTASIFMLLMGLARMKRTSRLPGQRRTQDS
jgi:hypothetical protein